MERMNVLKSASDVYDSIRGKKKRSENGLCDWGVILSSTVSLSIPSAFVHSHPCVLFVLGVILGCTYDSMSHPRLEWRESSGFDRCDMVERSDESVTSSDDGCGDHTAYENRHRASEFWYHSMTSHSDHNPSSDKEIVRGHSQNHDHRRR